MGEGGNMLHMVYMGEGGQYATHGLHGGRRAICYTWATWGEGGTICYTWATWGKGGVKLERSGTGLILRKGSKGKFKVSYVQW